MKKYTSLILALVLLIVTIFIPEPVANDVKFGKGKGDNATISTLEDTEEVIGSAIYLLSRTEAGKQGYDSLSLSFERDCRLNFGVSGNGNSSNTSMSIKNSNTYYINKDGDMYITSTAIISSSASSSNSYSSSDEDGSSSTSTFMDFDAEMYVSLEDNEAYMRITRLEMVMNGTTLPAQIKTLMTNKWIDLEAFGEFGLDSLTSTMTEANLKYLALLDEYVSTGLEKESFKKNGSKYEMSSSLFEDFMADCLKILVGSTPFEIETSGDFKLDLSKPKAPKIEIEVKYDFPSTHEVREPNYDSGNYFSPSYTTTTYNISSTGSYERLSYQFYNIDNTIVEFDVDSKDIYDFEDLEDLAKDLGLED